MVIVVCTCAEKTRHERPAEPSERRLTWWQDFENTKHRIDVDAVLLENAPAEASVSARGYLE